MSIAGWLNWAWMLRCQRELSAFHRATYDVAAAQAEVLRKIVAANRETAFGRQCDFAQIRSPRDFQSRIPLATYEGLQPWVERAAAGERRVLTQEPIRLFEPTSGTTAGEKLIPYTASLRREFQRGIAAWIGDLFSKRAAVRRGRAYWSISPAFGERQFTKGGIPIGFDDDAAYLGGIERIALRRLLVTPSELARTTDMASFRYATLLHLTAAKDLALVSIWNPSFLTVILRQLVMWERLSHDLRRNNPRRAEEVASICRSTGALDERVRQLWPHLAVVSCWTDAAAAEPAAELREICPHVEFQSKGLLATEGFVSLPLCDQPAPALSLRSHFFEFLPSGDLPNNVRLAHELDRDCRYQVAITTGGGLYRYQLHDEVEVVGHLRGCPLLRFLGKADKTSDLVGEKLAEPFVRKAIEAACQSVGIKPRFVLVAAVMQNPPRYRVFLQAASISTENELGSFADELQSSLETNPHYRYAVELGQLMPIEVALVNPAIDANRIYADGCIARGQRLGNIKPTVLDRWPGWAEWFAPHVVANVPASDRNRATPPASPARSR